MNLRWLVKQDGTRVLQAQQRKESPAHYTSILVWVDIPEVPEKDPIMTDQENSA